MSIEGRLACEISPQPSRRKLREISIPQQWPRQRVGWSQSCLALSNHSDMCIRTSVENLMDPKPELKAELSSRQAVGALSSDRVSLNRRDLDSVRNLAPAT